MFWTTAGSMLIVEPEPVFSSPSYTGIKSMPMGDFPGLSEM